MSASPPATASSAAFHIPAFRRGAWYESRDQAKVGVTGLISLLPAAVVSADVRLARRTTLMMDQIESPELLRRAVQLFVDAPLEIPGFGVQDFADFSATLYELRGIPQAVSRAWAEQFSALAAAYAEKPAGQNVRIELTSLPANTFLCLESVLEILARGSIAFIRPSQREPVSAARFVAALLKAGLSPNKIEFCPMGRETVEALLGQFDHTILYGGAGVADRYSGSRSRTSLDIRGPGRAVALVPDALDDDGLARLVELIAGSGGRLCTNVRAVLVRDGAEEISERLGAALDNIDPVRSGPLNLTPVQAEMEASRVHAWIDDRMADDDRTITTRSTKAADGWDYWWPRLIRLAAPTGHPLFGAEFEFPFATIAEVSWPPPPSLVSDARYLYTVHRGGLVERHEPHSAGACA